MKIIFQHFTSLISALVVVINLGFWVIPLAFFGLLKFLIPFRQPRHYFNKATEWCYRGAVSVHNFWMFRSVGINVEIEGEIPDHPAPIIVSNHQTWMDIPVLHAAITTHGPVLKFLIKRELLWVPIIGWICYALNFPRLNRGKGSHARARDLAAIHSFSQSLNEERGGLMIYAEGTRFTELKHTNQASPYKHLLTPRPGGLKIAIDSVPPDTPILDVTIVYQGDTHFWHCLGGSTKSIKVVLRTYTAGEVDDVRTWLAERWREKDQFFET